MGPSSLITFNNCQKIEFKEIISEKSCPFPVVSNFKKFIN